MRGGVFPPTFHRFEVLLLFLQIDDHRRRGSGEQILTAVAHLARGVAWRRFLRHHQTKHFVAEKQDATGLRPVLDELRALSELLRRFIQDVQLK